MKVYDKITCDVCIVGGGTAGAVAAIKSAELGLDTIVVEQGTVLGGSQVMGLVTPMMGHHIKGAHDEYFCEVHRRIARIIEVDYPEAVRNYLGEKSGGLNYDPVQFSCIYEDLAEKAGLKIAYESSLAYVNTEDGKITTIGVTTRKGLLEINAKVFIDGTGDATLALLAGCEVEMGGGKQNQNTSLRFEMGGIDFKKFGKYIKSVGQDFYHTPPNLYLDQWPKKFKELLQKMVDEGDITKQDSSYMQLFSMPGKPGSMSFNCPEIKYVPDGMNPFVMSKLYAEGRRAIVRLSNAFKKHVPGFENAYVSNVASLLGVRESRRVKAVYTTTVQDLASKKEFADAFVYSNYPIDIHGEELEHPSWEVNTEKLYYEVPTRSLIAADVDNLAVVGRCAGFDFLAQSALRIQQVAMASGEAAAHAAKQAIDNNTNLKNIDTAKVKEKMITA